MKISRVVYKQFAAAAAAMTVFGVVFVGCGGGGGGGSSNGGGGPPAPAPRNVAISCGGGAGDATLTTVSPVTSTATLTGNQQVPPVCTGAVGTGTVTVDTTSGAISGSITLDSIVPTMAHIHEGAAGANGGIIITLVQNGTKPNQWDVPASAMLSGPQLASFAAGNLYFNAHTSAHTDGEIRGQIGRGVFTAAMTSAQERLADSTAKNSTATGTGMVVLDPSTNGITGSFSVTGLSGSANAGHIHTAATGTSGGVTIGMTETLSGSGTFTVPGGTVLTGPELIDLRAGNLYFNVHTAANPNGEIRGQIGRAIRIAETFSGANQVPVVMSSGSGTGFAVLDVSMPGSVATRTFSGSMTINNITPTMAHIHEGAVGVNGGIVVNFTVSGSASPFSATIVPPDGSANATIVKEFLDDATYMNVHTVANSGGEIRGQLDIP